MARKNGFSQLPISVAELGPGDSLGIGLAARISGVEEYYALDVVTHANLRRNIGIFQELVALFNDREDIPGEDEFPELKPHLESYEFPRDALTDQVLNSALNVDRLDRLKRSITAKNHENSKIRYVVPWSNVNNIKEESIDFIYSQAVLEHVDDLRAAYRALYSWLKPAGLMSHQIDFKCHGLADEWNGHWTYSDFQWKLIRGNRPYLINRNPHSTHLRLMKESGFKVRCDLKINKPSNIRKSDLAGRFKDLSNDDLTTSGVFVQATK
jgi:SAM-dependent methyltransferase